MSGVFKSRKLTVSRFDFDDEIEILIPDQDAEYLTRQEIKQLITHLEDCLNNKD